MTYRPTVRGRRLARELRRLRENQGLTLQDVADRLGWSRATVSRLETGQTRPRDVAELLDLYGVASPDRDALLTLSREARQMGWWTAYVDVFSGSYVGLEDESSEIRNWDSQLVHGLLQTEDYARAVITAGRFLPSKADIDRRIHARKQRQALLDREDAPHLHVILDESAVRRPIGGDSVIREQLLALVTAADRPNVTIQVMPYSSGAHAGLDGRFTILSFQDPADPDIAYVEGTMGDVYVESAEAITQHRTRFERIEDEALSPAESVRLLAEAAKE
ncbi:helix-turn-helix transcriptional regulator [Actinocorallia sp. A-T 12471]|uniref:helix-turn-helix domain-containing protein n=1 Tax=Actinocorallia sp. A-T 12471 TaxID=3089813 RepID=UPI0029D1C3B8|nr:helix-turn-helix transcriptional regulator [Actinocorallia sp. A-T 12471]MDX6742874.1 helix-turn-helix transcriptional regulator [Actinocorallia sp. A-T 12471]